MLWCLPIARTGVLSTGPWDEKKRESGVSDNSETKHGQINEQTPPVRWAPKRLRDSGTDNTIMRIYGDQEVKVGGKLPSPQVWWL